MMMKKTKQKRNSGQGKRTQTYRMECSYFIHLNYGKDLAWLVIYEMMNTVLLAWKWKICRIPFDQNVQIRKRELDSLKD